jgi:hypothetical protein
VNQLFPEIAADVAQVSKLRFAPLEFSHSGVNVSNLPDKIEKPSQINIHQWLPMLYEKS